MKKIILTLIILASSYELLFAQAATSLSFVDTRSTATTPSTYSQNLIGSFKQSSAIGLPYVNTGYYALLGFRAWLVDNTGGKAHELAFSDDSRVFYRSGNSPSWENWLQIPVTDQNGNLGLGTTTPAALLNLSGGGSNANGVFYVQSTDAAARGTLMKTGFYEYNSQDNSGNYFQSWGMRLNGSDNLWYRTYTGANDYLPYTELTTSGTIVFGGTSSNLTTNANPTLNTSMIINVGSGNVGIGTVDNSNWQLATSPYKLAVNGSIVATAMTVKLQSTWPDYVFKNEYRLPSLENIKTYIDQNHHLPDMPSEQEVTEKGLNLGEVNRQLTKKVEELTLYLIENQQKQNDQQKEIEELKAELHQLINSANSKK